MKNNKGVTIIELVVSMTILIIVTTFLFQIILSLKEIYNSAGLKTELLSKQALMSKMINEDFKNRGIEMALRCNNSESCLSLYFKDGTNKKLELVKKTESSPAYFIYGTYKTELPDNSDFGNYEINTTMIFSNSGLNNDSILNAYIPIKNPMLKNQDFGINIVYQYNSRKSSITDISIDGNNSVNSIWLAGSSNMIWYTTVSFEDPGYYYLDGSNNLVKATETTDEVEVTQSEIVDNQMTITYQSVSDSEKKVTRTVNFINTSYDYKVNNSFYEFSAPVTGLYKIEAWGASGVDSGDNLGGTGAFTSGLIDLKVNDKIYVYVGSTGNSDNGGYNGGGSITLNQSEYGGASGGGATDIRLKSGSWDSVDGLRSRIMVASGGAGATPSTCGSSVKIGGNGGSINSSSFSVGTSCTASESNIWTLAGGANQSTGGALTIYDVSNGTNKTVLGGNFGMASTPKEFTNDVISGGGGGYYGGTNSGYGSPATGGSSFVSGCTDCLAINSDGSTSSTNIHYSGKQFSSIIMEDGSNITNMKPSKTSDGTSINYKDGFARITLFSVSNQG